MSSIERLRASIGLRQPDRVLVNLLNPSTKALLVRCETSSPTRIRSRSTFCRCREEVRKAQPLEGLIS